MSACSHWKPRRRPLSLLLLKHASETSPTLEDCFSRPTRRRMGMQKMASKWFYHCFWAMFKDITAAHAHTMPARQSATPRKQFLDAVRDRIVVRGQAPSAHGCDGCVGRWKQTVNTEMSYRAVSALRVVRQPHPSYPAPTRCRRALTA